MQTIGVIRWTLMPVTEIKLSLWFLVAHRIGFSPNEWARSHTNRSTTHVYVVKWNTYTDWTLRPAHKWRWATSSSMAMKREGKSSINGAFYSWFCVVALPKCVVRDGGLWSVRGPLTVPKVNITEPNNRMRLSKRCSRYCEWRNTHHQII